MAVGVKNNVVDIHRRQAETRNQVLERLFKEHNSALRGFLNMRLGVTEELDDVVQEVFARLAKLPDLQERLPVGGSNNRSFLFAVANNYVMDMERRKVHQRRYAESRQVRNHESDNLYLATPESIALAAEDIARLREVIVKLKPAWRDAFVLVRIKCMSYREAAREMGVTVKKIEAYIKGAMIQIRKADLSITGVGKK